LAFVSFLIFNPETESPVPGTRFSSQPFGCSEDAEWWSYPMPLKLRLKGIVPGTGILPSWVSISYKFCVSNLCHEFKLQSKCFV